MGRVSYFLFVFFLLSLHLYGEEKKDLIHIHFNSPTYENGTFYTSQGGIATGKGFKIQAKIIRYTKNSHLNQLTHTIYAKGDLMLDYHGQIFLGEELFFDFEAEEGYLTLGKTQVNIWYLQGDKILFHKDKSYEIEQAKITTSDLPYPEWEMTAKKIYLSHDNNLSTKDIRINFFKIPIFWIPGFRSSLNNTSHNFASYNIKWISGQGPQFMMKYKIYSGKNFETLLRLQYLYGKGPSAAFEAYLHSEDKKTFFKSKNYYAHDTFYRDTNPNKRKTRFRLQGVFSTHSSDEKASAIAMYDKISDKNLPSDFKGEDFELNPEKKTQLYAHYLHDSFITGLHLTPRINSFDGFNQKLPSLNLSIKPLTIASLPLIFDNKFSLAFYDYVYTNLLQEAPKSFQNVLTDFHSLRGYTSQLIYSPLTQKGVHFTPYGGFVGIVYSNSPNNHSAYQGVFKYGIKTSAPLTKHFTRFVHKIEPYIHFHGSSKPSQNFSDVYIFGIDDGYHRLNMSRLGLFQSFSFKKFYLPLPNLTLDLFALGFFGDKTYQTTFPKAGFESLFQTDCLALKTFFQWNFNNHLLDVFNTQLGYTLNPNVAFKVEFRHRSKYFFRKDDYDNYIVESARSLENLLDSPMSDKRNTLLSKIEIKLLPNSFLQLQTQSGWGRNHQKGYHEAKIDFYTILSSSWKLRLSYTHTTRADIFTCGINLIKK